MSDSCPHCVATLREDVPGGREGGSRVIGVEEPGLYDGVLYWMCPDCKGTWHRWPENHYLRARAEPFVRTVETLPPIERPDGRMYRPRKIVAHSWDNEEVYGRFDDYGVFVFGTHDIERARLLADRAVKHFFDSGMVPVNPERRWVRLGYQDGQQAYIDDPVQGRAAIQFNAGYPEEASE